MITKNLTGNYLIVQDKSPDKTQYQLHIPFIDVAVT